MSDGSDDEVGPVKALAAGAAILAAARRVMLTCHLGPDGDALGSMSALAALLVAQGREVTLYHTEPPPRVLRGLPHMGELVRSFPTGTRFDATVVVDCGDRRLLGPRFPAAEVTGPLVVLDHHASIRPFGDVFVSDPSAACVGVLVARLARVLGWPLTQAAAQGIFVSLVSDTGSFRYANTDAEAFALATELVAEHQVIPWAVARTLDEELPLARYRLLAAALATLELELDGKIAVMTVVDETVQKAGAKWEHTDGLVNYARAIEGVECGVLLSPARDGGTRASLRSKGHLDAGAVCQGFGGGGHRGAAGCVLDAKLPEARRLLLEALAAALAALPPP